MAARKKIRSSFIKWILACSQSDEPLVLKHLTLRFALVEASKRYIVNLDMFNFTADVFYRDAAKQLGDRCRKDEC